MYFWMMHSVKAPNLLMTQRSDPDGNPRSTSETESKGVYLVCVCVCVCVCVWRPNNSIKAQPGVRVGGGGGIALRRNPEVGQKACWGGGGRKPITVEKICWKGGGCGQGGGSVPAAC